MKQYGRVLVLSGALFAGSTSVPLAPIINLVEAASLVNLNNTVYQTTANLNLRTGAGPKYKVLITIPKGKQVTATSRSGDWYKVTYSDVINGKKLTQTGWVAGSYLKKVNTESKVIITNPVNAQTSKQQNVVVTNTNTPKTMYQTTANLNIRSGPSAKNSVIKTIPMGGIVSSSEKSGSWVKVSYTYTVKQKKATATGWVSEGYIKEYYQYFNIKGSYFTNKDTHFYSAPDKKKNAILKVSKDNGFQVKQKVINSIGEAWLKVDHNGKSVYVQSTEITSQAGKSFSQMEFTTNKETYLFSSYGNVYTKLIKIPKNTKVYSKSSIGNWYSISINGKSGYIYGGDLQKYIPPVVKPAPIQQAPVQVPVQKPPVTAVPTTETVTSAPKTQVPDQSDSSKPAQVQQPEVVETAINGRTYVTMANLNLRKAAAADSEILAVIPGATFINPTHSISNGWFKVMANGKTGFVAGSYIKEIITGDPMHREGYQFIDLRKPSKVTAVQINHYINTNVNSGRVSVLTGKGQTFIDAGTKYGVNALYLAAHAIHESAFGTSNISIGKYNLFGFGAFDATPYIGAVRFASIEQNIDYIAQELVSTYLNPASWKYKGAYLGYSTRTVSDNIRVDSNSVGMNFYYASDVKWGQKIASHMQKIFPYNSIEYTSAANKSVFAFPTRPEGVDAFPSGIMAVAKRDIKLVSQKGSNVTSHILKKDAAFNLIEKHNDYWLKVSIDNKEYWTSDIKLERYKEFITVRNLGRVTASSLNVRVTASTGQPPIGALKLNDYIHLMIDQGGNLIMDGSKSWYNVKLTDGRTGWVSAQFVNQELR
jgi:mannosyl-glycoprotein endo-beta-N-acetylglucosaminidase